MCRASRQPVVWAPISAFLLNLAGLRLPSAWLTNFTELGQAAGGVALFALGLLLTTRPWRLTRMVVLNVLLKNLGLPVLIWGIMASLGVSLSNQQLVVLTLAIPTATIATMLAVQNHLAPDEYVATQMLSTVIAPLTMGFLMWGLQLV
ncbi:AEC family transporter [Lactiplantibacillus plantarum]|uniref:AEC family transporter n=1 Tax=Lactiplantibacillus plantarum TaxID=1590 RepID=UPI0021C95A61|nr:AEC family transporter [Lactiplantibacillus plantarum]MCW6140040.1 AEC family transporter [Lactiplantibacillus plantarum]MCX8539302.1 AEC family transporter [Lactiplantibacillus plantarum]